MKRQMPAFDQAYAALITDLASTLPTWPAPACSTGPW